jgi:peptidoglycan hydrolase-like protein with peptidoglycan-binding domain
MPAAPRPAVLAALVLAGLAGPVAPAAGQDPAAPPPVAPATPPPPAAPPAQPAEPAPAPVQPRLALAAERVGPGATVLTGDRWRVRGTLTPYVPGQRVTVSFHARGRQVRARSVLLRASRTGRSGSFVLGHRARGPHPVTVTAAHDATPELAAVAAAPVRVQVLPRRAAPGSSGPAVLRLQERLRGLGYVVGARGRLDARTARAVLTFRKVVGLARTSSADETVFRALARGRGAFRVRFPEHGRHVEADLGRQVLALIGAGGKVERIYPTSTGAPVTPTVLGSFRFYRKDPGTNALGMVHSSYFIRGYAIHGYASVPTYPASHGCLRVPVPDALAIFRWVRLGGRIDVYR